MINRFSSLYAGHIDLGDMGQAATPANDRRYSNEELAGVFTKTENLAIAMDKLGYDTLWLAEHHFQHEGYECLPNLPLLGVHLCHLTEKLKIGCGFNVAPMWHPLRLAEDFATADILTKGRVIFGVARGYHSREVETFGGPMLDQDENREYFEEQVEVMMKALKNESFSHRGKFFDLPPKVPYRGYELEELSLVPRPVNDWECWQPIVSANPRGLDFMARHRMKGVVGGGSALMTEGPVTAYRDALGRAGIDAQLGEGLCIGVNFHLAETREKAAKEATPFFEEHIKMFAPLGFFRGLTEDQHAVIAQKGGWGGADIPSLEASCDNRSWYCGPPEGFIEYIQELEDAFPGLEMINVQASMGTPEHVLIEQLEIFSKEVMPAFQKPEEAAA